MAFFFFLYFSIIIIFFLLHWKFKEIRRELKLAFNVTSEELDVLSPDSQSWSTGSTQAVWEGALRLGTIRVLIQGCS